MIMTGFEPAVNKVRGNLIKVIGVGGGRILDIAKFVAAANQWPSIAIATNLAHDGLASPVSILDAQTGRTSVGVTPPVAVIVDLDLLKSTPPAMLSAGIGDIPWSGAGLPAHKAEQMPSDLAHLDLF